MPSAADAFPAIDPDTRCPCFSGSVFAECCRPFLAGAADAPTAPQLMRSRYTAFVTGDDRYLLATWHPSTRPEQLALDPMMRWYRLDLERVDRGGPLDRTGVVEFTARYRVGGERGEQHEASRFVREHGRWFYVDAID